MATREARTVRAIMAALLVLGTVVWALGREGHDLPTSDLHADAAYYYVYLPAILRGDLDLTTEYRETRNWYQFGTTATGRPSDVFGVGPAVVDSPLFFVGHLIARALGERRDGFSEWEIRLFTWASLPWSLGAMFVAYRLVRRRVGGGSFALAGPLLAALAGPVVYYAVRQPGYAHPMATFFATLLVERWDATYDGRRPRTLRTWLVLGAILGAAALVRPQLALWGVVLAHAALDDVQRRADVDDAPKRVVARWLAAAATATFVFAPQMFAWKVIYGRWLVVPQGAHFMRWDDPCWSEVLFSSRNGLFPWSPAYALFLVALILGRRRLPRLAAGLLVGLALQTFANGAVWDWWGGGSFGGRRFDSAYPAFAVGAALLLSSCAHVLSNAVRRDANPGMRAIGATAALVVGLTLDLVYVNLCLVRSFMVTTARIGGGEAAAEVIRARVPGRAGWVTGLASALTNLPARAAFAWRHDASMSDYDRVVGVHVLGDTYPGLNGPNDERTARIDVHDPRSPLLRGLAPAAGDTASIVDGSARVLVVLNRDDLVEVRLRVDGDGVATVLWNGRKVIEEPLSTRAPLRFRTRDLRRGANDLVIQAPPGSVVHPIEIEALPERPVGAGDTHVASYSSGGGTTTHYGRERAVILVDDVRPGRGAPREQWRRRRRRARAARSEPRFGRARDRLPLHPVIAHHVFFIFAAICSPSSAARCVATSTASMSVFRSPPDSSV
jgi:hypothetical protein